MTDTDLQLVREFFELHRFKVFTQWQSSRNDTGMRLYVENADDPGERNLPTAIKPEDMASLSRATVDIRAWHSEKFYASVFDSSPVLTQFVQEESLAQAREFFRDHDFVSILVLSELPVAADQRARALDQVARSNIDHVIEFSDIMRSLIEKTSINGSYSSSPTLHVVQLMKRYRLVKNQQMEFSFPLEAPPSRNAEQIPDVETESLQQGDERYSDDEWS